MSLPQIHVSGSDYGTPSVMSTRESETTTVDFIVECLRDPYNPSVCSGVLVEALVACIPLLLNSFPEPEQLRNKQKLCESIYPFLIAKRDPLSLKQWMERFAACGDCRNPTKFTAPYHAALVAIFHEAWEENKRERSKYKWMRDNVCSGETYAVASCVFIAQACHMLRQAMSLDFKPIAQGTSKLWPKNMASLMPDGPDQTMESLVQWYKIHPEPSIADVSTVIFNTGRSLFIIPSLPKFGYLNLVMDSTKRYVHAILSLFDGGDTGNPEKADMILGLFMHQTQVFTSALNLINLEHHLTQNKLAAVDGCEIKMIQILSLLVSVGPKIQTYLKAQPGGWQKANSVKDCMAKWVRCGWSMYRHLGMEKCPPRGSELLVAKPIVDADSLTFFGSHDGFESDLGLYIIARNGRNYGCAGKTYGCNHYFESAGRDLKFCEQCIWVYYCGKDCQAKIWNDEQYPHKKICLALSKVVQAYRRKFEDKYPGTKLSHHDIHESLVVNTDFEQVEVVRDLIHDAHLTREEAKMLKRWGRKLYKLHYVGKRELKPGYEDYDAIVKRLTDPNGTYRVPQFKRMNKSASQDMLRKKASLR
ncbi:hypothetical protein CVT24_008564 [Panaeolus cyanescens]|uniref:MYND-type domain-containing protein n=1 Tax=Panaeolus cyanescens TaxID=181874 RepID=A0A409VED7_9AGAR|nr:hypothetical protein CVT24_008564 [Panaeolus cyanescens]